MSNRAIVYRSCRNSEYKAADELREAGARAYVPPDRSSKKRNRCTRKPRVTAPGYVFADRVCSIAFAKHVKSKVGSATRAELANLYIGRPQRRAETDINPYRPGQTAFRGEIAVTVTSTSGRCCCIEWDMCGKRQSQSIHYTQLRPG